MVALGPIQVLLLSAVVAVVPALEPLVWFAIVTILPIWGPFYYF